MRFVYWIVLGIICPPLGAFLIIYLIADHENTIEHNQNERIKKLEGELNAYRKQSRTE